MKSQGRSSGDRKIKVKRESVKRLSHLALAAVVGGEPPETRGCVSQGGATC